MCQGPHLYCQFFLVFLKPHAEVINLEEKFQTKRRIGCLFSWITFPCLTLCVCLYVLRMSVTYIYSLISLAGAVASMFWVDAELGSDIYLDGKMFGIICDDRAFKSLSLTQ